MIKKISQLNELPISAYTEALWNDATYGIDKEEAKRKEEEMMFEVSYETETPSDKNNKADEVNYYTSYSINLSGMKEALTINNLWEVLSVLSSGGLSIISGNLIIGTPGEDTVDRLSGDGHKYNPDEEHYITAYSRFDLQNELLVHGETNFHNTVTITCDDEIEGEYPDITNPILKVGGAATFDNVVNGVSWRAKWGDLAEYYLADENYEPGTLVKFGGEKEVTIAKDVVNGVVTSKPGVILNGKDENETSVGVALAGKVPVKVRGPVRKFDKIVLSHTDPGMGVVYNFAYPNDVIARALEENQDPGDKLVMCVTKFNLN